MSHTPLTSWFWRLGHISSAAAPSSHAPRISPRPIQGEKCRLSAGRELFSVRSVFVAVDERDGRLITDHGCIFPPTVCFVFPFPSLSLSFSPPSRSLPVSLCAAAAGQLERRQTWALLPADSRPINHVNMLISGIYFIQQK